MNLFSILFYTVGFARILQEEPDNEPMNHPKGGYRISNSENKPTFRGEYFEIDTQTISFDYGEVYWKHMDPVPFPEDVKKSLNGGPIYITGFEFQIMRKNPVTGEEERVPAYEVYNHHCQLFFRGESRKGKVPKLIPTTLEERRHNHGSRLKLEEMSDLTPGEIIAQQIFIGAESRGTYVHHAKGYALKLDRPQDMILEAMLINIGKPGGGRCTFPDDKNCPVPKMSLAPTSAHYSGILECPCTDKTLPKINKYNTAIGLESCKNHVKSAKECFNAVKEFGFVVEKNTTTFSLTKPSGCSITTSPITKKTQLNYEPETEVVWNTNPLAAASCASQTGYLFAEIKDLIKATDERIGTTAKVIFDEAKRSARLIMTGPSETWFAYGFGGLIMHGTTAFVALGDGTVQMRGLGLHNAGQLFDIKNQTGVTVLSNDVVDGVRTVIIDATIDTVMPHKPHYFETLFGVEARKLGAAAAQLLVIAAAGTTPYLSIHQAQGSMVTSLLVLGGSNCICQADPNYPSGTVDGVPFMPGLCNAQLQKERNPICSVKDYAGGLWCCRDGTVLLDSDQVQPSGSTQKPYIKMRFYYETGPHDGDKSLKPVQMTYMAPEGFCLEYDIVKGQCSFYAEDGTCVHELKQTVMLAQLHPQMLLHPDGAELVYLQGHCHTGACISQEFYDATTGELICRTTMKQGDSMTETGNEAGYFVGSSACIWGHEKGLKKPPRVYANTLITTRKLANATYGHYGDMAGWTTGFHYLAGSNSSEGEI